MIEHIEPAAYEAFVRRGEVASDAPATIQLSIAISLKRLADAADRISECADGIHPSAFRVIQQE